RRHMELLVQPADGADVPRHGRQSISILGVRRPAKSGSAGVPTRSDYGEITFREWHPVGVEEYGYAAPDPLHPGIVFGGKVTRFDERTGDVQNVGPVVVRDTKDRFVRTAPILFSPADPHVLFF